MTTATRDPWFSLATRTPARIGLGRAGASLPTREVLAFALAHARARDAVHASLDRSVLAERLTAVGLATVEVGSEAVERRLYLSRPDLGRRLSSASRQRLVDTLPCDLAIMIGDGLSASAVAAHAPALIDAFLPFAVRAGLKIGTVALAVGARVALGDEIGTMMKARAVVVLIGERPGLSAADGLGVYLTYAPCVGRTDAERNCISNIRPGGLAPAAAAAKLAWLVETSLQRGLSGVSLKDESDALLPGSTGARLSLTYGDTTNERYALR